MNLNLTAENGVDTRRPDESRQSPDVLLSLQNVSVAYEGGSVVQDVCLSIHAGESVLFLGPSGCGKSTLAMVCAGLIPRSVEGVVTGTLWRHPGLLASGKIGYVFQDADSQFCMLTVADEMAFGLENVRVAQADMYETIAQEVVRTGLTTSARALHAEFSGGMKQKLAIASALAMDADLIVLDEPTANLDPLSTRQVFDQIGRLHDQQKTMIVIEHKFDALLAHMDTVVLLTADGRIHRVGPTRAVIREEWSWLVSEGVVAPWKERPQWSFGDPRHVAASAGADSSLDSATASAGGSAAVDASGNSTAIVRSEAGRAALKAGVEAAIEISNGTYFYKQNRVWSDLSLSIPRGSFTAIVGPNGAGKSTLLQVMGGLAKLDKGDARLLRRELKAWKRNELADAVSYCFQNPEFQFIYERVGDELANRVVGQDVPEEIRQLLAEFGLHGLEQQSPFALSQGQKRRLSVATMVREDHQLYLLDEPTFGQDARTQQAIMERLEGLHRQGKTIVMTTHDMDLVQRYAQQVIVLAEGQVLFTGTPAALFGQPDVLRRAHLLDDVQSSLTQTADVQQSEKPAGQDEAALQVLSFWGEDVRSRRSLAQRLNPPWLLVTTMTAMLIAIFASNLSQGLAMLALPVALLVVLRRLTPWQVLKRLSPFLGFYVLYVWSLTAFAAVKPGTATLDFLWFHLSWPGFMAGLVLAFRMLGAVAFGVLFVSSVDITDLIVGLSQNFRVPPKFAYGILAGIRFMPLFQSEWEKLKQARKLRGKERGYSFLRPVTYALPLLSQAIRMSERVATAMEARGFYGDAAASSSGRTYFRIIRVRASDFGYMALVVTATVLLLWLLR